jgi:Rrf2 family protein
MPGAIQISEAASIGLHTTLVMAEEPERFWNAQELSERLQVSAAHLAKVMQALGRAGLVKSLRGPKGGCRLAKPADEITLLEVYEAIEGPMHTDECLLEKTVCKGNQCQIGKNIRLMNQQIRKMLAESTLESVRIPDIAVGKKQ